MMGKHILLVTHPDDELVNMSHFFLQENSHIILITETSNVNRYSNFLKLIKDYNKNIYTLSFTEGYLLSYDRHLVYSSIGNRVQHIKGRGDVLVIPSPFDTHPEHLLVSSMGTRIANDLSMEYIHTSSGSLENTVVLVKDKKEELKNYYPDVFEELTTSNYLVNSLESYTRFNKDSL